MRAIDYLLRLNAICNFQSIEKPQQATNSEIRRWFQNKAVVINGAAVAFDLEIDEIFSLVLFPKSKRKITLK